MPFETTEYKVTQLDEEVLRQPSTHLWVGKAALKAVKSLTG